MNRALVSSKTVFINSIFFVVITTLAVYFFGLPTHQTVEHNALVTTSILSFSCCVFLTAGLYYGVKLRDDIGRFKIEFSKNNSFVDFPGTGSFDFPCIDLGEGLLGGIIGIILGFIAVVVFVILLAVAMYFFTEILWIVSVAITAGLYAIFYRAIRRVFTHAHQTRGDLLRSVTVASTYTMMYVGWAVVFLTL